MNKIKNIIWGIILTAFGIVLGLNALKITDINIFFDGWWTLIIIVPCFVGLFTQKEKAGNLIGIVIGVFLLLCSRDVLEYSMIWELGLPVLIVSIGVKMIMGAVFKNKKDRSVKQNVERVSKYSAVFAGADANFSGETFNGAQITAVFGGATCDLRGAVIDGDSVINAVAVFGGIDIFVPEGVNVKVNSNSLFGGVDNPNHKSTVADSPTVYIDAVCLFGGIDIK